MKEIEKRIFVSEEIYKNEYEYYYGKLKNKEVTFMYLKNDKEGTKIPFKSYSEALHFARYKGSDLRYKNYEFLIYI